MLKHPVIVNSREYGDVLYYASTLVDLAKFVAVLYWSIYYPNLWPPYWFNPLNTELNPICQ